MDPELEKLARGLGIDPVSLGGTSVGVKDGPTVYFGSETVESSGPRYQQNDPKWKPDSKRKVLTTSDPKWKPSTPRNPVQRDSVKTLEEANAAFYEMEEAEVATLQRRLVAAGILDPDKVRFGDYDDDTYSAFAAINERTAKFNAVGKKFTPSDVLGMIERNAPPAAAEAPDPGRVSRTSNPLDLESQVQAAAQQRLGRKLRKQEVSKFVSLYQGLEGKQNARINSAADQVEAGTDVTIQDAASPDAAADQYLDANFAQEAAGEDAYDYLGALRNLIGG